MTDAADSPRRSEPTSNDRLATLSRGRTNFQIQSPNSQSSVALKLWLISRTRVFWKAVSNYSPPSLTATSVWIESRAGEGLLERDSDRDLSMIADFLSRNTERLRTETGKLDEHAPVEVAR